MPANKPAATTTELTKKRKRGLIVCLIASYTQSIGDGTHMANIALLGSYMVRLEDVGHVAEPVLTHRIITTFAAQAEGISAKQIVRRLVEETKETA